MKTFTISSLLVLATLAAQGATGIKLGDLQLAGTACQLAGIGPIEVTIDEGKLQIPASIQAKKIPSQSLIRASCNFSLPVQLDPQYRLVLSDSSILGLVNLSKGTKAKISVGLFKAGGHGQVLEQEDSAETKKLRKNFELSQPGEVIVLNCGESGIIRGNASIVLQGTARATASIQLIELDAKVEACEQQSADN